MSSCRKMTLWMTLVGIVVGLSGASAQEATHGVVDASPLSFEPPRFRGPGSDEPLPVPGHPPLDQIPPMPMPEPGSEELLRSFDTAGDSAVFHDPARGTSYVLPPDPSERSGSEGGSGGGYAGPGLPDTGAPEGGAVRAFSDMVQITNTDSHPWRMNVKLVMRFIDQGSTERFFVCSGSMIDAETVLTAGHCVYARSPNGINIFDWAEEIWVYPGWDGDGSFSSRPVNPYGFGHGTFFMTWTSWINDGNWDRDAGLVEITRAVGMLTGWYGWAWGFSCGTIQGRTYHNASYPSQSCPLPGLHNGSDMYYWWGSVDSCPDNQLRLDTGGGNCFDTLWGGMSGSSMYYIVDGNRYAHAVASTSNRDDIGNYCKLWEDFINEMNDTYIPGARTGSFDLQALNVNAGPSVVQAGDQLSLANFFATNPTNGSDNGTWFYDVYLSTNDNVSEFDTPLGSQQFNWNFNSMSSVTVNMVLPTIPIDTPSGDYWVGVVLDSATDSAFANNDTDGWDAQPITVNAVADPMTNSANAPAGTFDTGESISVDFQLENQGADPSNTITLEIRASLNTIISVVDPLLGTFSLSGLSGGEIRNASRMVTLPHTLSSSSYYVGVTISASDDVDVSNNVAHDGTPIVVQAALFADGFESGDTSSWANSVP